MAHSAGTPKGSGVGMRRYRPIAPGGIGRIPLQKKKPARRSPARHSMALSLLPGAAFAGAGALGSLVHAATYSFIDLNPSGYVTSTGYGGGPNQQVGYGTVSAGSTSYNALLWTGTATSYINLNPAGYTTSNAYSAWGGWQVGTGNGPSTSNNDQALLWNGNAASVINLTPSTYTMALAQGIGRGAVVGVGMGTPTGNAMNALLWTGTTAASAVDLNPAGFSFSSAFAVNDGQEVGNGDGASTNYIPQALLWNGTSSAAVNLNPTGFSNSYALNVFNGQQVGYGNGTATANKNHALLWSGNPNSYVDLNPTGFTSSYAFGISNGLEVGYGMTGGVLHALLWSGNAASAVDLNPTGYTSSVALAVDPYGIITGYAVTSTGSQHAMIWYASNNKYYENTASTGSLGTASNWLTSITPVTGDNAYVTQTDSVNRTITNNISVSLNTLSVDATGSGSLLVSQSQNFTTTSNQVVGLVGNGAYNQTSSINTVGQNLLLGQFPGSFGTYTLGGGSLQVAGTLSVGSEGGGSFNQLSGAANANALLIGDATNAFGTMGLGGGTLLALSATIGNGGTGAFDHTAGTATISGNLTLGNLAGSSGSYVLQGSGSLAVGGNFIVGNAGAGAFTQSAGASTITGNLIVAATTNSTAIATLTGGSLSAASVQVDAGGTVNLGGATLNAPVVVAAKAIFNFTAGSISGAVTNSGSFNVTGGGTRTLSAVTINPGGILTVTSTTLKVTGALTVNGVFASDPSTNTLGSLSIGSAGYLTGGSGDLFQVNNSLTSSSTQKTLWNTSQSTLEFTTNGASVHDLSLNGSDDGHSYNGFTNNFAWGELELDANQSLVLENASGGADSALYVSDLDLAGGTSQVSLITGNGQNIYYDQSNASNAYLGDKTYALADGGDLEPVVAVPEPTLLAWLPVAMMGLLRRRRRTKPVKPTRT